MKEASYYKKLNNDNVQCELCPRNCIIKEGDYGFCNARKNIDGTLYSIVYAKPCAMHIDPIEKKPLYHFMPGENALSIGTSGCNLECKHCQNWSMSRSKPEDFFVKEITPEQVVENAIDNNCKIIAYTYNEPTVFYEYMIECAKLAKKKGIKNVIVSNGFINQEPLKELCKYIDGANIDLKSFDNDFYKKITNSWIQPVLESLKILKKNNVWLEITMLIIPKLNDDPEKIKQMCNWIRDNLGKDVPLHFSAFYPCYKLLGYPPTKKETLLKARKITLETGLKYVYVGNVGPSDENNTHCYECNSIAIERLSFGVVKNNLKKGKCPCGENIPGVFE